MTRGVDRTQVPAPGALRPFNFPVIDRARLSNGLPLLVARTDHLPVVTMAAILPAGGVKEISARAGLARFTSSLLESGAGGRTALQIAEAAEGLGVRMESSASWDRTLVGYTGLSTRTRAASEILEQLICSPDFPAAEVKRLRNEQLAEIVQRRAEPRGLANEMAARFMYAEDAPYSRPLGGTPASIRNLTKADAEAFHSSNYTPNGAALIVAGAMDASEAMDLAEARFGGWAGPAAIRPVVNVETRHGDPQVIIVNRPGSVQSEIRIGHLGVGRTSPDYFPLIVMNTVLGGAFSSRLNLNLREANGFTYGVSSSFSMRRDPGLFLVSTAVQTEVTADAVTEILREIDGIRAGPVTASELVDARNYLAGTFPLRLQTTHGIASRLAELVIYGLPDDYFASYRDRILEVEDAEILRVARENIRPDELTLVIVGDADAIRSSLEALDLGIIETVDPATLP
ncbi:MAG TPA: pitrilysin family protein [Acidimicrobiia bacterium]|nr:pitrilysin family protein [Acidimicrobiia bacterium]